MQTPKIELVPVDLEREPTKEELHEAELETLALIDAIVDIHREEELSYG